MLKDQQHNQMIFKLTHAPGPSGAVLGLTTRSFQQGRSPSTIASNVAASTPVRERNYLLRLRRLLLKFAIGKRLERLPTLNHQTINKDPTRLLHQVYYWNQQHASPQDVVLLKLSNIQVDLAIPHASYLSPARENGIEN